MGTLKLLIILFVNICLLNGCLLNKSSSDYKVDITTTDRFNQNSSVFLQNEDIHFTLSITNISKEKQTLTFPDSGFFDIAVNDSLGNNIWSLSFNRTVTLTEVKYEILPNETLTEQYSWNQHTNENDIIAIGSYFVEGKFKGVQRKDTLNLVIQ